MISRRFALILYQSHVCSPHRGRQSRPPPRRAHRHSPPLGCSACGEGAGAPDAAAFCTGSRVSPLHLRFRLHKGRERGWLDATHGPGVRCALHVFEEMPGRNLSDMSLSHLCRFHVWVNRGRRGRRKRRRASLFVLPFHVGVPRNDGFMIRVSSCGVKVVHK